MRNITLIILLSIAFCVTELTWLHFYPNAIDEWEEWKKYFAAKDATYDAMFFVFSLLLFWNFKDPLLKSMTVFLVIVTGGSFIDKVIFKLNQYLFSDIALIALGLILSILSYLRWKISKRGV